MGVLCLLGVPIRLSGAPGGFSEIFQFVRELQHASGVNQINLYFDEEQF